MTFSIKPVPRLTCGWPRYYQCLWPKVTSLTQINTEQVQLIIVYTGPAAGVLEEGRVWEINPSLHESFPVLGPIVKSQFVICRPHKSGEKGAVDYSTLARGRTGRLLSELLCMAGQVDSIETEKTVNQHLNVCLEWFSCFFLESSTFAWFRCRFLFYPFV